MGMPDADAAEIDAGAKALAQHPQYSAVIGTNQARNIAYTVLVAARGAKIALDTQAARAARSAAEWQSEVDAALQRAAANGYRMDTTSADAITVDLLEFNSTFEDADVAVVRACCEDWLRRQAASKYITLPGAAARRTTI